MMFHDFHRALIDEWLPDKLVFLFTWLLIVINTVGRLVRERKRIINGESTKRFTMTIRKKS